MGFLRRYAYRALFVATLPLGWRLGHVLWHHLGWVR